MRSPRGCFVVTLAFAAASTATALADSFPTGVTYPLKPAALQPSGLAQPLPSTRRYVLVWQDQLIPDGAGGGTAYSPELMQWVVTHYVGTQKLFQSQIDSYRALNPNFLTLTYHLAYGLNGADQTNPVGNITGPNTFGQEDTDTFTPWVAANGAAREDAYQHSATPDSTSTRVSYPDPYWLMDIGSTEWQSYLQQTLLAWATFPTTKSTGFFFDVAFPPWYNYSPATWWTGPAGGRAGRRSTRGGCRERRPTSRPSAPRLRPLRSTRATSSSPTRTRSTTAPTSQRSCRGPTGCSPRTGRMRSAIPRTGT